MYTDQFATDRANPAGVLISDELPNTQILYLH